ncbi:hypothetical protein BJ742DRAFT_359217 [Cladochytrium replicatum]|nr:hypothetical protein BJ742DRAFT_359217 [Cladochytrium replicatum]
MRLPTLSPIVLKARELAIASLPSLTTAIETDLNITGDPNPLLLATTQLLVVHSSSNRSIQTLFVWFKRCNHSTYLTRECSANSFPELCHFGWFLIISTAIRNTSFSSAEPPHRKTLVVLSNTIGKERLLLALSSLHPTLRIYLSPSKCVHSTCRTILDSANAALPQDTLE